MLNNSYCNIKLLHKGKSRIQLVPFRVCIINVDSCSNIKESIGNLRVNSSNYMNFENYYKLKRQSLGYCYQIQLVNKRKYKNKWLDKLFLIRQTFKYESENIICYSLIVWSSLHWCCRRAARQVKWQLLAALLWSRIFVVCPMLQKHISVLLFYLV